MSSENAGKMLKENIVKLSNEMYIKGATDCCSCIIKGLDTCDENKTLTIEFVKKMIEDCKKVIVEAK